MLFGATLRIWEGAAERDAHRDDAIATHVRRMHTPAMTPKSLRIRLSFLGGTLLACDPGPSSSDAGTSGGVAASSTTAPDPSDTTASDSPDDGASGGGTSHVDSTGSHPGTSGEDPTGSEDAASGDGMAACGATDVCVPVAPAGWNGPAALRDIDVQTGVPQCGGEYTELLLDYAFANLVAPDYECGCECGVGTLECNGSARLRYSPAQTFEGFSPCTSADPGGLLTATIAAGTPEVYPPHDVPVTSNNHGVTVDQVVSSIDGACTAMPSETATDTVWTERTIACGTQREGGGCEQGQTCVARPLKPFREGVCVWTEGDVLCPEGYPDREIRHQSVSDTRDCSTCSCGNPNASCQNSEMNIAFNVEDVNGNVFLGSPHSFDAPNEFCESFELCSSICLAATYSIGEVSFDPGSLLLTNGSAPCPPSGGQPTGEALPDDPLTMCCTSD